MINNHSSIDYNFIKSDIGVLSEQFLRGEVFTLDLSEYVFGNINRVKEKKYSENVEDVKKLLGSSKVVFYYDLVLIKSNIELSEEQKIVMVRYINMCHHDKNLFILFNGNVIYIPMEFIAHYGKEAMHVHINTIYKKYNNERKLKYISRKIKLNKIIPFLQ
jgi:hypothetical protein